MAATPISDLVFHIDRKALDESAHSLVGMDRGCSLTKAVFVPKDDKESTATHYALHCVVFSNSDFEGALHFLKEKALLPSNGKLPVTGAGCEKYRETIEKITGLEVEFVSEFLTMFRGTHFLLSHVEDRQSLFYPEIPRDPTMVVRKNAVMEAQVAQVLPEMTRNNGPDPDAIFPCIFVIIGSGAGPFLIYPDGKTKASGGTLISGKSLLGLGKALAGTSNYDQLLELANAGRSGNVDTTVEEFIVDDPKSPYGFFPPHMPLFPFGKFWDLDQSLEEYSVEDRAAAVVRFVALNVMTMTGQAIVKHGVSRVVFGGHGVRGEAMRREILAASRVFMTEFDIKFLRTGATGALGAMISKDEEAVKYFVQ